jgi:hypothetical protein
MMKRMTILVLVLLLGGATMQAALPMVAQTGGPGLDPYTVNVCTAAGGGYRLSSLGWQITGAARGGSYGLSMPEEAALRGSGCCCTYLPLVLSNQ